MAGAADAVTGGEETANRGHAVIDFSVVALNLVTVRHPVKIRSGSPQPAAPGVGSQQIGLRGHDLRVFLFRLGVGGAPQVGLSAGHVKKVFPCL